MMSAKACPSCRYENKPENYYCTQCGYRLRAERDKNPCLRIVSGQPDGAVFFVRKQRNTIGRDGGDTIVLADEQVSNKHAILLQIEEDFWIEDRGSKNGVFIDGKRIQTRQPVRHGSLIKLGATVLRFENDAN